MIKLGETPVDEAKLLALMINDDVVWLHIAMHDSVRVGIVKSSQDLVDIISDVLGRESRKQGLEVAIVDVFENERWDFGMGIATYIEELDNVGAAAEAL